MFTGIVEEVGAVAQVSRQEAGARLRIRCSRVVADAAPGSSIAVDGVCLTAAAVNRGEFEADLSPETLARTSLGDRVPGDPVNLERPLALGDRLGGHLVQGHVDGTGECTAVAALPDDNWWLTVRVPAELGPYVMGKGSITFDGISLTVAALDGLCVSVAVIPHTWENTALRRYRPGDRVNIEVDAIAKYVERLMGERARGGG